MAMAGGSETTLYVKPAAAKSTAVFPLTQFDLYWLGRPPVDRVFFYPLPAASTFASDFLPALTASLAHMLDSFLPLAARLRLDSNTGTCHLVYSPVDPGVVVTVAEINSTTGGFDELAAGAQRELAELLPMVPRLPSSDAAFAVRMTVFPGKGVALGISVHHACCDGAGTAHFLHSWSAACRLGAAAAALPPPVLDRSLVRVSTEQQLFKRDQGPSEVDGDVAGMTFGTFVLDGDHLQQIKNAVASYVRERKPSFRCSTAVAAYGFMWACDVRSKLPNGVIGETAYIVVPLDYRRRLDPPLPDKFFGSCIGPCYASASAGELAGEEGFLVGCEAIADAIVATVAEGLDSSLERWRKAAPTVLANAPLSVAGSHRFGVYGVDFGWGRPARVDIPSVFKTGAMAVAESPHGEGLQVGVVRPAAEMERARHRWISPRTLSMSRRRRRRRPPSSRSASSTFCGSAGRRPSSASSSTRFPTSPCLVSPLKSSRPSSLLLPSRSPPSCPSPPASAATLPATSTSSSTRTATALS